LPEPIRRAVLALIRLVLVGVNTQPVAHVDAGATQTAAAERMAVEPLATPWQLR